MNPHRRHTFDIPAEPRWPRTGEQEQQIVADIRSRQRRDSSRAMQLVLAAFFAALLVVWVLSEYCYTRAPQVEPVRTPTVQVFELPAVISIEEARIEGFRAGMATAAAEGCPTAGLTPPIAAR